MTPNPFSASEVYKAARGGLHYAGTSYTAETDGWHASCSCGWTGPRQDTRPDATADIVEHLLVAT